MQSRAWRAPLRRTLARRRWRAGRPLATSGALWAAIGIAFVLVVMLGVIGFTRSQQLQGPLEPFSSRMYLSLQLFVLQSGAVSGPVPWQLEVGRFAAPVVAGYTILLTLAAVFYEQVAAVRLRAVRGHVVVAGLGRKGWLLVAALLRRGEPVVVIEASGSTPELEVARRVGALVVIGDARSPQTQRRAGVARARQLVALTGVDATNVEVLEAGRQLARRPQAGTLRGVAHLEDPELSLLVCGQVLDRYGPGAARLDVVNVTAAGVRKLLEVHPPFAPQGSAHVAIVGTGSTARELALALARSWATRRTAADGRLRLTVSGLSSRSLVTLGDRHPEFARFAQLEVVAELAAVAAARPNVAYVCPADAAEVVSTALALRRCAGDLVFRIVVVLEQGSGLEQVLERAHCTGAPSMVTFGLLDEACSPDSLLTGTTELLARALHRTYLNAHPDRAPEADPVRRPWAQLPETLRESNRDHAAHIGIKLAAVGRSIGPLTDWDAAGRPFTDDEVEVMARLEHDRWVAERRRGGWRPGPRDPQRRTTPYLVPWEELAEEIREYDRLFVRQLPRLLASVGLEAHDRSPHRDGGDVPSSRSGHTRTLEAR
jgi:voltage-gated potassium channel Kch